MACKESLCRTWDSSNHAHFRFQSKESNCPVRNRTEFADLRIGCLNHQSIWPLPIRQCKKFYTYPYCPNYDGNSGIEITYPAWEPSYLIRIVINGAKTTCRGPFLIVHYPLGPAWPSVPGRHLIWLQVLAKHTVNCGRNGEGMSSLWHACTLRSKGVSYLTDHWSSSGPWLSYGPHGKARVFVGYSDTLWDRQKCHCNRLSL